MVDSHSAAMRERKREVGRNDRHAAAAWIERAAVDNMRVIRNPSAVLPPRAEPGWAQEDAVERSSSQKNPGRHRGREPQVMPLEIFVVRQNPARREAERRGAQ